MLASIALQPIAGRLFRFANITRRTEALASLGLLPGDIAEILTFLGGEGSADDLLDAPFRHDPSRTPTLTRFSDGSWRVFYAARDWETAAAEVGYHIRKAADGFASPLFYQRLSCTLVGNGYDLTPHADNMPFLTSPDEGEAYTLCQNLAREAIDAGADGLLTISARMDGVNVPVFQRHALSDPTIIGAASFVADGGDLLIEQA